MITTLVTLRQILSCIKAYIKTQRWGMRMSLEILFFVMTVNLFPEETKLAVMLSILISLPNNFSTQEHIQTNSTGQTEVSVT